MAERHGYMEANAVTTANEIRGLLTIDRANGNILRAITPHRWGENPNPRGSSAFEWRDLIDNQSGFMKWLQYRGKYNEAHENLIITP